jgi:hypothetical protein
VLPSTTCASADSPLAAAIVSGDMPFAVAIDQRVSPWATVCGTDALAGAQVLTAASAATATVLMRFKTASQRRINVNRTPSSRTPGLPSARAFLWQAATCVALLLLAGCGSTGFGQDVKGFTQQAKAPAEQAVLRSIATYRTTADEQVACGLVTQHFLTLRFDGKRNVCEAVARHQEKRELPKSASVESIAGDAATVRVAEVTATRSLYKMKREGGTWRIDDIVEAK